MKTIHSRKQSGSSLVVVISVLATLMVIVGVAAEYTWTVNRHVQRSNTVEKAVAVADSCIDILFANWRAISRTAPTTAQATSAFSSIPLPTSAQLNLPAVSNFAKRGTNIDPNTDEAPGTSDYDPNFTISNYKVIAVSPEWTALAGAGSAPKPELGLAQTGNINTTAANFDYIASADVTLPALGPTGKVVAKVRRSFQKQQISPWNYAIFYVDPLEIHPGPQFTVTGWVHTNSDLYTGHDTLTFADKVTYGSDWFAPTPAHPTVGFMPGDLQHPQPPPPTAPHYPGNLPPAHDDAKQPFGLDSTQLFSTTDPNPNNDSYHELIELPSASSADPLANSRYWDQASVVIRINADNTYSIGTPHVNGSGVYDGTINVATSGSSGALLALYNMFNGAISTGGVAGSIQDNREGAGSVRLATLDISQILNASGTAYKSAGFTNPIIYIYDASATSHPLKSDGTVDLTVNKRSDGTTSVTPVKGGIRVKGGSKIPTVGLTIASNNPVYIQGDFNTGGNPPSNSGNAADAVSPQVAGYTRAPCSILADAINILSNGYVDGTAGAAPLASNTTINAAIVSGIVPTNAYGLGNYSGGAENFPRFLEDWTANGNTLTYYGSMVELYKSQQSTGEWTCCNPVYSPPIRQWYFDNNFKIKPPPGTLMVYSYVKGKWSVIPN